MIGPGATPHGLTLRRMGRWPWAAACLSSAADCSVVWDLPRRSGLAQAGSVLSPAAAVQHFELVSISLPQAFLTGILMGIHPSILSYVIPVGLDSSSLSHSSQCKQHAIDCRLLADCRAASPL